MDTVGNLIDKLSIVNIRIWFAEDVKRVVADNVPLCKIHCQFTDAAPAT